MDAAMFTFALAAVWVVLSRAYIYELCCARPHVHTQCVGEMCGYLAGYAHSSLWNVMRAHLSLLPFSLLHSPF